MSVLATMNLVVIMRREKGPSNIFGRFRDWAGVYEDSHGNIVGDDSELSKTVQCWRCLSVYVGTIFYFFPPLSVPFAVGQVVLIVRQLLQEYTEDIVD